MVMLEVERTAQRGCTGVAEMATNPSLAPLQKHSPGGWTIDMPPSNYHWRLAERSDARRVLFHVFQSPRHANGHDITISFNVFFSRV